MTIDQRKADHIRINLDADVGFNQLTTGLEKFRFEHQALPELNLHSVNTSSVVFDHHVHAPILISSMTGGTDEAYQINQNLAQAAQIRGIAMGVGSQRAVLEDQTARPTFHVRNVAPDILLFANIGAVQLNHGYTAADCQAAVDMIEANALILHLNPLQEVFQTNGDIDWRGLLTKIGDVCCALSVPVIVKEVGWGISEHLARALIAEGVAAIDVAGAGGTSWSQVEMHRNPTPRLRRLGAVFRDWGIPTAESIQAVDRARQSTRQGLPIFASGGLRNGLDIAKCIALGADLAGLASPFLRTAVESVDAVVEEIDLLTEELRIAMFCSGAHDLQSLRTPGLLKKIT